MPDVFAEQLSAYLDGELDGFQRRRLEGHLSECAECAALLADLRAILAAAPHYEGKAPERDLWPELEARLGEVEVLPLERRKDGRTEGRKERLPRRFGWRELIAASIVMTAVGGGATWLALRGQGGGPTSPSSPSSLSSPSDVTKTAAYAEAQYDFAVRELEQRLEAGRSKLDTATVRVIEENLRKIDLAIAEARTAIQRDPANAYLSRQIAANMRRKLNLLRVATNAIAART